MEYRTFGTTDLKVSPMGLGCMSMSGVYGTADDSESIATLHRAFDPGIDFLDTSASYGNGHNHELIAKAIKGRRDKIVIHSKSGSPRAPDASGLRGGSTPDYLMKTCEESLGVSASMCLTFFACRGLTPMSRSRVRGRHGAPRRTGGPLHRSLGSQRDIGPPGAENPPHVSLQMEYSLWSATPKGALQACREFGMGLMAYSPLGRGSLAGAVRGLQDLPNGDSRGTHPRFQPSNLEHNLKLLAQFEEVAKEQSVTPAQLALAWLMAQGENIIPIPSNKTRQHLDENLKAIDIKLTKEDLARLDVLMPPGAAAGARQIWTG